MTTQLTIVQRPTRLTVSRVGVQGPQGGPGPAGGEGFQHAQPSAAATWIVNHNLGRRPAVDLYTTGWVLLDAALVHVSANQAVVTFNSPQAGFAVCS